VVSFTPLPLYSQGKSPWYPLDRRLSGPQSRYINISSGANRKFLGPREVGIDT